MSFESVEFVATWMDLRDVHAESEKAMAPHSSTLAWKIPWMEEPGRLQSILPRPGFRSRRTPVRAGHRSRLERSPGLLLRDVPPPTGNIPDCAKGRCRASQVPDDLRTESAG